MTCAQCGTEIADKALICYKCGTATRAARLPPAATRRPRRPLLVVALLLLVAIAAFVAWRAGLLPGGWLIPLHVNGYVSTVMEWRVGALHLP